MSAPAARRGLLDTSAVIDLADLDAGVLPGECLISAITLAELSVGALVASGARERAARQAHLQQAEADFDPLPFDAGCARAYDALIAATAIANGLPVYTRNTDDFAGIDELTVRAV